MFVFDELEISKLALKKRIELARTATNFKTLAALAADSDSNVRMKVVSNSSTPKEMLTILATDVDMYVRARVASNPNTSIETLTVLATDVDPYVLRWVANNTATPAAILNSLAAAPDYVIRGFVASNINTPVSTLAVLATDSDEDVRCYVAQNTSTSAETLAVLAADPSVDMRWRVAGSLGASNELLWCLLSDPVKELVDATATRLQQRNLSSTEPTWANPQTLKTIYDTLQTTNLLNSNMLIQLLKAKVSLSQTELIDLCELYDKNIRNVIKTSYPLKHPLLKEILKPSKNVHSPVVPTSR